ncbi:MAG: tetratricopeptide repeat protein [Candidatus Xenobia bacterium]
MRLIGLLLLLSTLCACATPQTRTLDEAIALYPREVDAWLRRARAAGSALRAVPFMLTANRLKPMGYQPPAPPPIKLQPHPDTLALSRLADPPQRFDGLGKVHLGTTTKDVRVQQFFDQGLALLHGYVTPSTVTNSAARCFQYCINLDPDAPLPWWGLSFCVTSRDAVQPLPVARHAFWLASQHGSDLERRATAARVLELEGKRAEFQDALDGAIAAYPDQVELYVWLGKGAGSMGGEVRAAEGVLGGMPYELAALLIDPEHPGANHELVHDYEAIGRPELGWPYAVALRKAAPDLPHAQHMLAHLAMRLGRWEDAVDATGAAWEKARQGYPELDPLHHLSVRLICLGHQGMFREAERIAPHGVPDLAWARLLRWKADTPALQLWAAGPDPQHEYVSALLALDRGDLRSVRHLQPLLQQAVRIGFLSPYCLAEVNARYLIASGHADQGFARFRQTAARAINDDALHAFGGGGYFPEVWGEEALRRGRLDTAVFAFQEALAHDQGSVVGALGMQVVCERRHQVELARSYAAWAARLWRHADPGALSRQLTRLRSLTPGRACVTIPWLRGYAA